METNRRICFYLEYKDLKGGYTTLIISLIREMHRRGEKLLLFNFKDGLISQELKKKNIEIEIIDLNELDWNNIQQFISSSDVLIVTSFLEVYQRFFKVNPFIVYYSINLLITEISNYKYGLKFDFLGKKLINQLEKKNALIFMDDTSVLSLKRVFHKTINTPVFLPIPVRVPDVNVYLNKTINNLQVLNITYVGRSIIWKMMPLKKLIDDCAVVAIHVTIKISIVVDSISDFENFINLKDYADNENLNFYIYENMLPSEVDEFLQATSDIHFAMGTAALDAGKFGVPTVLIDGSNMPFPPDYSYRWLYESKNFSLGRLLDDVSVPDGVSMQILLSSFLDPAKRNESSVKSFDYVKNFHSLQKVVPRLLEIGNTTSMRIRDAKNFVPYYFKIHRFIKSLNP